MARRRGDQPVDQTRGLDLVAPAESLDDALHVAATLAGVLDEVEILVGSVFFSSRGRTWRGTLLVAEHHDFLRHHKQNRHSLLH